MYVQYYECLENELKRERKEGKIYQDEEKKDDKSGVKTSLG